MPPSTSPVAASPALSQDGVNGRVTGALFFIGFGTVWVILGLRGMHGSRPSLLVAVVLLAVALLAVSFWLFRLAKSLPAGTLSPEQQARARRMFTAVNIIQWVSVFTAVLILNVLKHPDYIPPAIAIIVGLHLFPLAQSFGYRQHHVTGVLLVLWAAGCMALLPQSTVAAVCSIGVGVILLASAGSTLLRCVLALRRPTSAASLA